MGNLPATAWYWSSHSDRFQPCLIWSWQVTYVTKAFGKLEPGVLIPRRQPFFTSFHQLLGSSDHHDHPSGSDDSLLVRQVKLWFFSEKTTIWMMKSPNHPWMGAMFRLASLDCQRVYWFWSIKMFSSESSPLWRKMSTLVMTSRTCELKHHHFKQSIIDLNRPSRIHTIAM